KAIGDLAFCLRKEIFGSLRIHPKRRLAFELLFECKLLASPLNGDRQRIKSARVVGFYESRNFVVISDRGVVQGNDTIALLDTHLFGDRARLRRGNKRLEPV